jgi:hypothetical protein
MRVVVLEWRFPYERPPIAERVLAGSEVAPA